jgi:hypothetical protein
MSRKLSIGQLRERHREILVEAGKGLDLVLSTVARHATTKRCQRQVLRDLRENQFAQVHQCPLRVSSSQDYKSTARSSNRDQKKSSIFYFRSTNYLGYIL